MTTAPEIARERLHNQLIATAAARTPADAVRHLGAVQAQDFLGALWAVGARTRGATEADVERAIAERRVVRTWPMRRTLHLVPAADVRWMLELLAARALGGLAALHRTLELTETVLARATRVAEDALAGDVQLTRPALYARLEAAGIATRESRGLHITAWLAQRGVICFGARAGKQPTLALLDEWAPGARSLPREEALAELARRYVTGHGPATAHDLAWWSGLPLRDVRAALDLARPHVASETIDGREHWRPTAAAPAATGVAPGAYLLPYYDEYTVAYRDRSAVLAPEFARQVQIGGGVFKPILVLDGLVAGTWSRTLARDAVSITVSPFAPLKRADRAAVAEAAERYGAFLGLPTVLVLAR